MTKIIKNLFLFVFFTVLIFLIIINGEIVISSTLYSANLFFYKVFPTLFPFFVLIDFLINYDFPLYINKVLNKPISKIFKINPNGSFIILLSIISGLPSNAKLVNDMLEKNGISITEANKIMAFTFFPNPMFVIGTVGTIFFQNYLIGVKILLIIYLSNFIVGFIIRNKFLTSDAHIILENKKEKFSGLLKKSLNKTFETLLLILGSITIFTILSNLFSIYSPFNEVINAVITGIFEMTSGIASIFSLSLPFKSTVILVSASLSFTGLCILSQAASILTNEKLDFKFIIKCRVLTVFINFVLVFLLF